MRRKSTPWWREELQVRTKAEAEDLMRGVVARYPDGVAISAEDAALAHKVLSHHYQYAAKCGAGVAHTEVRTNPSWNGPTRGFWLVRTDGTAVDISWVVSLMPGGLPTAKNHATTAARYEVAPQIHQHHAEGECGACPLCGEAMKRGEGLHVDHEPPFDQVFSGWLGERGLTYDAIELLDLGLDTQIADRDMAQDWQQYHRDHAGLRLTHGPCNLSRGRG